MLTVYLFIAVICSPLYIYIIGLNTIRLIKLLQNWFDQLICFYIELQAMYKIVLNMF